ncbi:MFS transporter [Streptomyces sp. 1222.5]|uniref:MFS transporter n=1 Tax=Streptomyces sp. 1222.5 TaxID=1881026 RepID=UPI003D757ADD
MSRPSKGGTSYRAVLALPHARKLFAAAMLARLSYGLLGLPLLLTLKQATGSYAVAGTASGVFGLVTALLAPARARLVSRRPRALMALAGAYASLLGAIAVLGVAGAAPWLAIALATAAGTVPPPVGPLMRTLWGRLATDQAQRQRALSLDTVSESTVFALGPAVGGVLISETSPALALASCIALVLVGFGALGTALRGSAVELRPTAGSAAVRSSWGLLRVPGFAALLLVVFSSGGALAVEEIAAVASWGAGVTGWLLALCSVGGALGGLAYGRRTWRLTPAKRLALLAASAAACLALPALFTAVPVAAFALLGLGVCSDTLLITSFLLVDSTVPTDGQLEAGTWVSTSYNLGIAAGSAFAGALLDQAGSGAVFALAAATASAGALVASVAAHGSAPGSEAEEVAEVGEAAEGSEAVAR